MWRQQKKAPTTKYLGLDTMSWKSAKLPNQRIVSLTLVKCIEQSLTTFKKNLDVSKKQEKKRIEGKQALENGRRFGYDDKFIAETVALTGRETLDTFNRQTKQEANHRRKKVKGRSVGKRFIIEFKYFARFQNEYSSGSTISYPETLRWFKEAKIFDNRRVTMRDVEVHFIHKLKSGFELTVLEFIHFLKSVCEDRGLPMFTVVMKLVTCRCQKTSDTAPLSNLRKSRREQKLSDTKKIFCKESDRKPLQVIQTFKANKLKQPNGNSNENTKDTINTKNVNYKTREHGFYIDLRNAPIPVKKVLSNWFDPSLDKNSNLQTYEFIVSKNGEKSVHYEKIPNFKASTISEIMKNKPVNKLVGKSFSETKIKWNKILKKVSSVHSYFDMVVLGNALNIDDESEIYEYTPSQLSSGNLNKYSNNEVVSSCDSSKRCPLHIERLSDEVAVLQINGTTEKLNAKPECKKVNKCDSNENKAVVEKRGKQKLSNYFVSDNLKGKTLNVTKKRNAPKKKLLTSTNAMHTLYPENQKYRASAGNFGKNNVMANYNFDRIKKCASPNLVKNETANGKQTLPSSHVSQNEFIKKDNVQKTILNFSLSGVIKKPSKSKMLKNRGTSGKHARTFSNLPVHKLEKAIQKSRKRKAKKRISVINTSGNENSKTIPRKFKKRPVLSDDACATSKGNEFENKRCINKNNIAKPNFGKNSSPVHRNVFHSPLEDGLGKICKNKHILSSVQALKDGKDDSNIDVRKGSFTNSAIVANKLRSKKKCHLISTEKAKVYKLRKSVQLMKKEMNDPETEIEKLKCFDL